MKIKLTTLSMLLLFAITSVFSQQADTAKSQFAKIGDVTLHYKVYGKGEPLILLHGSMESMVDWDKQVAPFSKQYKVITLDSRGHGQSTFTDRKMDYALLSEDVVQLMSQLKIDSAYIVGFGDGGIIGLFLSINHPKKVKKLIAIGANYKVDTTAVYAEILNKVKAWDIDKMTDYVKTHFKDYKNYNLIGQFTQRMQTMLLTEPKLMLENLAEIKCPTLFIAGDHDIIKLSHTNEMFETVKQGYMSIIPGTKHYPQKENPALVNTIILDFLKQKFENIDRFK